MTALVWGQARGNVVGKAGMYRPHPGQEVVMGMVRKAGVWLGLIEDDDDREYGYDERPYDEDYGDEDNDAAAVIRARVQDRLAEQRMQREAAAPVRSLARQPAVAYPTRDNLALAPETDTRPRRSRPPMIGASSSRLCTRRRSVRAARSASTSATACQ
jgi:hypothetical protein